MDARRPNPDEACWLVLKPYRSHWEISSYPDSRVIKASCGHFAWLSPEGETMVDTAYTVCLDCIDLDDPGTTSRKFTVAGAVDSVRRQQGDLGVQHARQWMRRHGIEEL